ncbi:MAG: peptide-methionine (S)-S-oxide reductase MsrA [Paracoccaceae bacterium]
MFFGWKKPEMTTPEQALPGRDAPIPTAGTHHVLGTALKGPHPEGTELAVFGMGCFWGAERLFWQTDGVHTTFVGYAGGYTPNPTYREVCSGRTGPAEIVGVVFDPAAVSYDELLRVFWESHDPTQGMRQGNDVGTQYRSTIYATTPAQRERAEATKRAFEERLRAKGYGAVTTEIAEIDPDRVFFAEDYHQQYLAKNPGGYCGISGTGVSCPVGVGA